MVWSFVEKVLLIIYLFLLIKLQMFCFVGYLDQFQFQYFCGDLVEGIDFKV